MPLIKTTEVSIFANPADLPNFGQGVSVADTIIKVNNQPDSLSIGSFATSSEIPVGFSGIAVVRDTKTLQGANGDGFLTAPIDLFKVSVPVGRPSSGSIGNNGALTLTTALQTTYSQGAYMYFPANAIVAGSTAGLYWTVMSSTTLGTIYNNTYTSGTPTTPAVLVPFVTTGPGAYTQTTTELPLLQTTIPGRTIGKNGVISTAILATYNNSAGNKSIKVKLDNTELVNSTQNTSVYTWLIRNILNCNSEAIQLSQSIGAPRPGPDTALPMRGAVNTAVNQIFYFLVTCNTATDFFFYEQYDTTIIPRA